MHVPVSKTEALIPSQCINLHSYCDNLKCHVTSRRPAATPDGLTYAQLRTSFVEHCQDVVLVIASACYWIPGRRDDAGTGSSIKQVDCMIKRSELQWRNVEGSVEMRHTRKRPVS